MTPTFNSLFNDKKSNCVKKTSKKQTGMTKDEIHKLLHNTETSRIERTVSTSDMDK